MDPSIDRRYRNSRREFVDIYMEFRLPKGPESSEDEIQQAHRSLLRSYHPDVSQDKELALIMTQFANRAREVLKNERASYDARWRQERGRQDGPQRSGVSSSSSSSGEKDSSPREDSPKKPSDSSGGSGALPPHTVVRGNQPSEKPKPESRGIGCKIPLIGAAMVCTLGYLVTRDSCNSDSENNDAAQHGPSMPPPQDRQEEPILMTVDEQIEQSRQAISGDQAKKANCNPGKTAALKKAQGLVNKVEGTKDAAPLAFCPESGISFKDAGHDAQIQGFLIGENALALTPRFFDRRWTACDRATTLYALAQCRESGDCDAFEHYGANFYPGGEVGMKAADFYTRCEVASTPYMHHTKDQMEWIEVSGSELSQLVGNTSIEPGTDKELEREIIQHRACAAFTISCQNGVMRGHSFYWLQNTCPPIRAIGNPSVSDYPDLYATETQGGGDWFNTGFASTFHIATYSDIRPHPHIVCSSKSENEKVTGYRTFLSLIKR